jgi:choline dehydrogenase
MSAAFEPEYEYIVVGSGAGGGTVAARLAEAGRRVLLLEAGGDPRAPDPPEPGATPRLPDDYDVPAFHSIASEHRDLAWNFFVSHHDDPAANARDPKFRSEHEGRRVDGFLYPRAGTLGGCTAHNAMIWVYPHNADWDGIAALTGDASWAAPAMRGYFERIEDCRHRPIYRALARLGVNPTRHGWGGWLPVEHSVPREALTDRRLRRVVIAAGLAAMRATPRLVDRLRWFARGLFDPNDWRLVQDDSIGIRYLPLTTDGSRRVGTRERVLEVAGRRPSYLTIGTNTLVTRVLLDERQRAVGVEYRRGTRLYRAHARAGEGDGVCGEVRASREVVLAGGAFNSPQLLMLSGIGPPHELQRVGIPVRVPLPGVGANLQDRYEVSVVSEMDFPEWAIYEGASFQPGDAAHQRWMSHRNGLYATNGAVLTVFTRSSGATLPDLFCMGLVARFDGYAPGYSSRLGVERNYLTWVILKAHTKNAAGRLTLQSADPRDMPVVNFRQFVDGGDDDLAGVIDGVRFVRGLNERLRSGGAGPREILPGSHVQSEAALRDFVRYSAWGHHACGTCAIGASSADAVLDSRFRVRGTQRLRVVDASVFPRIPGFFIASAVYMIGEKAADAMLEE